MTLEERIFATNQRIAAAAAQSGRRAEEITLVAATKVQSSATIRAAIAAGIRVCGENRVQEMVSHLEENAYAGAQLHFIGHLQTNKVKQVVGRVELIHSVDSPHLLAAIARRAEELAMVQDILLQVNIAGEESKGGLSPEDLLPLARQAMALPSVRLRGLMCLPPAATEGRSNRKFFSLTHQLYVDMRNKIGDNNSIIDCLSMGMSGDFEDAILEGATLVRVGTSLFGRRAPMGSVESGAL